jgi:hypothetical protein
MLTVAIHLALFSAVLILPELGGLLKFVRPFLISISKAKAARLVRSLLDLFLDMEAATGQEVDLCLECIEWAKVEKRTFLRQALEVSWPGCLLHLKDKLLFLCGGVLVWRLKFMWLFSTHFPTTSE